MGELWRDLVETLRKWPALWLPVLVADLLSYLINFGRQFVLRAIVVHQTTQHSALGGAVVHGPMSASAVESTTIIALLLSWLTYFIRLLLYAGALVATAALIQGYLERRANAAASVGPALARFWGGILELALRALAVYAIAALLLSWLTTYLTHLGKAAVLRNPWFNFGITLLLLLGLAALLAPAAVRILSGSRPGKPLAQRSQQLAFILVTVAALLALAVGSNSFVLAQLSPGVRFPLELIGSLVVALPYVLLFVGLGLLARRAAREHHETAAPL